ncbi:hypothetical protein KA005_12425, partial [bacterium]|nr:hypothetical protein [bacterium]
KRPFVWFEIGFSWLRRLNNKCEIYAICAPPINPGNLPEPLCRLQNVSLENKKQTEEFFKNLVTQFGLGDIKKLNFSKIHKSLPKYPDAGLESILIARTIDNSGFQFKDMLVKAKDIFLVGQSFHHLTHEDNKQIYKNLIFKELQKRDISIRILLSNPDCQKAIDVWTQVTGPEYGKDVKDAIEVFKSWMQKFKLEKDKLKGTLLIKKTHLVPLTITFCDKGLKSGSMQLIPIINQGLSEIRPVCILYENEQPEIVQHYWSVCNGIFINRTKAKPVI